MFCVCVGCSSSLTMASHCVTMATCLCCPRCLETLRPDEIPGDGTDLEDPGLKNLGTVSVHLPRIYTHIYIYVYILIYIYTYTYIYIYSFMGITRKK